MKRIKANRACNVNGSQWRIKKGDILDEAKDGPWIVAHLLKLGFADEIKPKSKKAKQEHNYG